MNRHIQMMNSTHHRPRRSLLFLLVALAGLVFSNPAEARKVLVAEGLQEYEPWGEGIIELFSQVPVQDDGRIKPLETVARFRLYHLSGKRSLKFGVDDGKGIKVVKIGAVAWYLDCLFRPEIAKKLPCLRVDHTVVLTDIGLEPPGAELGAAERRTLISFDYLAPTPPENSDDCGKTLSKKREEYAAIARSVPKYVFPRRQQQLLNLHDRAVVMLRLWTRLLPSLQLDHEALERASEDESLQSTRRALEQVQSGVAFRQAYRAESRSHSAD